ncbi:MAG: hypothetical protein IJX30_03990 [Clostridia bacterium]|nr:hypothetical protein [Clostridia bacterium]
MRKPKNTKKEKVPRLTEAQYAAYINALKEETLPSPKEGGEEKQTATKGRENG